MADTEVTKDQLLSMAAEFDAKQGIEPAADSAPAVEDAEPVKDEAVKEESKPKADKPVSEDSKTKEAAEATEAKKSKFAANEERKGKTWQEINAEKEALKAEKEAIAREREEIQKAKASATVLRDEHGASAEDYRAAAKTLLEKGDKDLAAAAETLAKELDQKQQRMQQEKVLTEGRQKWLNNLEQLSQKHPDLKKDDSELSKETLKVLAEFPMLKQNPDGIKYAVAAADINLRAREFDGTKAELAKLKSEYEKLQKKLTISGGSPTAPVREDASIGSLPLKEQARRLEQLAHQHDRDNGLA